VFIGFDYGTANCSVAVMRDNAPQLLTMENNSTLLPSMLCAPTREAVSEWLYRHHQVPATGNETQALLRRAVSFNREEDIEVNAASVQFGLASLRQYVSEPEEVYFVKSPKSFLGASGLKPQQIALFEDLVCAMTAAMRLTPRRRASLSARRRVLASKRWCSSSNRSPLASISKRHSMKRSVCWWSTSVAVPPTAH